MSERKLNVEQLIERTRNNWDQPNLNAGATAVRLIRAGDIVLSGSRQLMSQFDLTAAEFDTLATLRKMPPPHSLNPTQLCQANLLSSGGLTKVLNNLQQRGLIDRCTGDEDRRCRVITLTKRGKKLIEESMREVLNHHEERLHATFSARERKELDRLLSKFHQANPTD